MGDLCDRIKKIRMYNELVIPQAPNVGGVTVGRTWGFNPQKT